MTNIALILVTMLGLHYEQPPLVWAALIGLLLLGFSEVGAETNRQLAAARKAEAEAENIRLAVQFDRACDVCGTVRQGGVQ